MTGPNAWFASAPLSNTGCYRAECPHEVVGYRRVGPKEWVAACREHKDVPPREKIVSVADDSGSGETKTASLVFRYRIPRWSRWRSC